MKLNSVKEFLEKKYKQDRVSEYIQQTLSNTVGRKVKVFGGKNKYRKDERGRLLLIDGIKD